MPSISYEYNKFERHFDEPLSEDEYKFAKKDFYNFYHDYIDAAEEKFSKMKNPHAFKWIYLWIKLGLGILFVGIDLGLKALGYYDAGEIFAMISFVPFFAVVIKPFQWLMSATKSSSFNVYEKQARDYYLFQYSKMKNAVSYYDYKIKLAEATAMEFMKLGITLQEFNSCRVSKSQSRFQTFTPDYFENLTVTRAHAHNPAGVKLLRG